MAASRRPKRAGGPPEIRVRFEPHRLAQECLERAYAQVVPPIRHRPAPAAGGVVATMRGAGRAARAVGGQR